MRTIHAPVSAADIPAALFAAQGFILGFENNADHDGIDDLLRLIEKAREAAAGQLPLIAKITDSFGYFIIDYKRADGGLYGWYQPPFSSRVYDDMHWHGVESMVGADGKVYCRSTNAIIDDFGSLVEVPQ